jgi:D-tyrosyl-tRNA(Tyr) deacylase
MRAVVQRVTRASVKVDGELISSVNCGFLVLLGISKNDGLKDIEYISDKILNLRIFTDEEGKMNKSIADINGELLVISQFTLYGDARKGRRPSFDIAASGETARPIYEEFLSCIKKNFDPEKIGTGIFGAKMEVELVNDGPVTILLDSERLF